MEPLLDFGHLINVYFQIPFYRFGKYINLLFLTITFLLFFKKQKNETIIFFAIFTIFYFFIFSFFHSWPREHIVNGWFYTVFNNFLTSYMHCEYLQKLMSRDHKNRSVRGVSCKNPKQLKNGLKNPKKALKNTKSR